MKKRSKAYLTAAILLVLLLLCFVPGSCAWEVREGLTSSGERIVISRRVVLPGQERQKAVASPEEAEAYAQIRVRWWSAGGGGREYWPVRSPNSPEDW
jgi:hypothetical protein